MKSARAGIGLLIGALVAAVSPVPAARMADAAVRPIPASAGHVRHWDAQAPPTNAECETRYQAACYTPKQFQTAYDLRPLLTKGITGQGQTIAIVVSFGSPTIVADLATFDHAFELPAPPSLEIIQPAGPVDYDPSAPDVTGWAEETSLDVEYAHAMAPGANILLVETPTDETEGIQGFPEIARAENYVLDHHLAQIISQSFGATEETFPDKNSLLNLRSAFFKAQLDGVTVLGASGDLGATDYRLDGSTIYDKRVSSWPSSDPLVTSVGGTELALDDTGRRTRPDVAWSGNQGASGGGVSAFFIRPTFQDGVKSVVGGSRGVPDISMSASVNAAAITYCSAPGVLGSGYNSGGWEVIGGTSQATPMFAGIVALAGQFRHGPVGDINPVLYDLAEAATTAGIVDVTLGDNSVAGVTGYDAKKGYDLVTGWGTVDAAAFVPALALGSLFAVHLRPF